MISSMAVRKIIFLSVGGQWLLQPRVAGGTCRCLRGKLAASVPSAGTFEAVTFSASYQQAGRMPLSGRQATSLNKHREEYHESTYRTCCHSGSAFRTRSNGPATITQGSACWNMDACLNRDRCL